MIKRSVSAILALVHDSSQKLFSSSALLQEWDQWFTDFLRMHSESSDEAIAVMNSTNPKYVLRSRSLSLCFSLRLPLTVCLSLSLSFSHHCSLGIGWRRWPMKGQSASLILSLITFTSTLTEQLMGTIVWSRSYLSCSRHHTRKALGTNMTNGSLEPLPGLNRCRGLPSCLALLDVQEWEEGRR
jgi:hypothetical protein